MEQEQKKSEPAGNAGNQTSEQRAEKKPFPFFTIALIAVVAIGGALWLSGKNNSKNSLDGSANNDSERVGAKEADSPSGQMAETKVFDISAKPFEFSVKEIKVKKGDIVRINLKNEQGFHDWVIDEFNAKTKQLKVGESDSIEFVADKIGTFEYYCSVATHRQMGMVGKLIVE